MDPDAAFETLLEQIADKEYDDAQETAQNLQTWLERGGFAPGGGKYRKDVIIRFVGWVLFELRFIGMGEAE